MFSSQKKKQKLLKGNENKCKYKDKVGKQNFPLWLHVMQTCQV